MRFSAYLFILVLAGSLSVLCQAKSDEPVVDSPVGRWVSVDFVRDVNDFNPERKNWQEELFLKEVEFHADGTTNSFFSWQNGWILHNDGKTKAQFYIRQMNNSAYLFLPWLSGDVTDRGQKPWYYVLKKAPDNAQTTAAGNVSKGNRQESSERSFQTVRPVDSVNEYDDVRWKDLSKIRSTATAAVISTLTFNQKTVWPDTNIIPPAKKPDELLKKAMNPGLGIRQLHKQGITGKGVNVAIIDQPLYQDHPEFAGKIVAYHDVGCQSESSMHGPAVASLLVGTNCGTAPDAKVYYVAAPSWIKDSAFQAKALDWIIEQNAKLPAGQKIRVVSVSGAPSGPGSPFEKNQQMWDEACARAEAAGILVLDCTQHRGFIGSCWLNSFNVEDVTLCTPGFPSDTTHGFTPDKLLAPTCPRTTAEQYNKNDFSYQYCGRGGLSWAIPYVAGVLAMGWQVNPDLTGGQMKQLLFDSAATTPAGAKIINPAGFIAMVKATRGEQRRTTKTENAGRATGSGQ